MIMLKNTLLYLFIFITPLVVAQNSIEKDLDSVNSFEKAKAYLKTKTFKKHKFIVFNEEKHKTTLAKDLLKLGLGATKTYENDYEKTVYKVVDKVTIPSYRASYIYLDGSKYTIDEIKIMQQNIIRKYKDGASFDFLAKQYSMDANARRGGDTGWFSKGKMHPEFERNITTVNENSLDDIYAVDIPSKNWHYVVLNTYKPKEISEIRVLKIVDDIE